MTQTSKSLNPSSIKSTNLQTKDTPSTENDLIGELKLNPSNISPDQVLQLQRTIGNLATQRFISQTSSNASPTIQRDLDPVTRRVRREESADWQTLLRENGYSKLDIKKLLSEEIHVEFFEYHFRDLITTDREIDDLNGLKPSTKRNRKNKIKDQIENSYGKILTYAENKVDEANDTYSSNLDKGVQIIRDYQNSDTRTRKGGNPIPSGTSLVKHEKDEVLPPLIKVVYGAHVGWVKEDTFIKDVFARYRGENAPQAQQLSPTDNQRFIQEKDRINTQLVAWQNVAANAQGVNQNGTWGTSATGSLNFNISVINPTVWQAIRKWWIKKSNAYVTPSETSHYSLKMDRAIPDPTKSERINYHINIG